MKLTLLSATLVTLGLLIGCGQSSTSNEPDANGSWTISFTPPLSPGVPTSSGVTLLVTFVQTGTNLSGTVTGVVGEPSFCFPDLSTTGTTFAVSGQLNPPVEAGANLFLTVTFMPTGTQAPTQMVSLQGALNAGTASSPAAGLYSFPSAVSGCTQGSFTMIKTG